jgi:hypothetical protein
MPTLYIESERNPWFTDHEGYRSKYKDDDGVESLVFNWSRFLGSDTISSSSWEAVGGLTLSSDTSTTTTATVTVEGTGGGAINTIVTAAGATHLRTVRYYARNT